jgi:hypothetical protein
MKRRRFYSILWAGAYTAGLAGISISPTLAIARKETNFGQDTGSHVRLLAGVEP